jgi:hypothetical protein
MKFWLYQQPVNFISHHAYKSHYYAFFLINPRLRIGRVALANNFRYGLHKCTFQKMDELALKPVTKYPVFLPGLLLRVF